MCISSKRPVQRKSKRSRSEVSGWLAVWTLNGRPPKKPTMKMSEASAKRSSQSNRIRVLDDWDELDDDSDEDVFIGFVENT